MISSAQLFVAVWLGCSCVYAVPVWATLALSKARRSIGAHTEFDHLIEIVEKRGLLPLGALLGCLLFPLSLAYDVVMIRAKLGELEQTKKRIEMLNMQIDAQAKHDRPLMAMPPELGGEQSVDVSLPPLPPGYEWAKCEACGGVNVRKEEETES
jgi:hypothetical protein